MIYLFLGENAPYALQKIKALKAAFLQKGGTALSVTEITGDNVSFEELATIIDNATVFRQKQLIILKHSISAHPSLVEFLCVRGDALRSANDVIIFWECALPDDAAREFFAAHAEKIQLLDGENNKNTLSWIRKEIKERGLKNDALLERSALKQYSRGGAWSVIQLLDRIALGDINCFADRTGAASTNTQFADKEVFRVVDALFLRPLSAAMATFNKAFMRDATTPENTLRVLLWQIRTMVQVVRGDDGALKTFVVQKTKRLLFSYSSAIADQLWWEGILADSAMRRDKKNTREHLERLMFSMKRMLSK